MGDKDLGLTTSLRDQVVGAIGMAMRSRVYKHLEVREMPDADECIQLIRSLASESDRAVPIILFGYLDHLLISLYEEELNPSVPGGASGILDGMAPLSTASARINVAQAVYWISDQVADHLRLLKSIRNEFAHNPFTTFEDSRVQGWISSAKIYMEAMSRTRSDGQESIIVENGQEWITVTTVEGLEGDRLLRTHRLDFVLTAVLLLHITVMQMYIAPTAWRLGIHPTDVLTNKEEWPDDIRDFNESLGDFIDAAFWQEGVVQGRISI